MITRTYNTTTKTALANAYGFRKEETLVARIRRTLNKLSEEQMLQLGEWTGRNLLLPDQVEIIVLLLGKPADIRGIYTETISH